MASLRAEVVSAVEANKGMIQPFLRLPADVFERTCQEDDHSVVGVGRLADETCVRCGLAGLDVTHHQAAALPWGLLGGVAQQVKQFIVRAVENAGNKRRPAQS